MAAPQRERDHGRDIITLGLNSERHKERKTLKKTQESARTSLTRIRSLSGKGQGASLYYQLDIHSVRLQGLNTHTEHTESATIRPSVCASNSQLCFGPFASKSLMSRASGGLVAAPQIQTGHGGSFTATNSPDSGRGVARPIWRENKWREKTWDGRFYRVLASKMTTSLINNACVVIWGELWKKRGYNGNI